MCSGLVRMATHSLTSKPCDDVGAALARRSSACATGWDEVDKPDASSRGTRGIVEHRLLRIEMKPCGVPKAHTLLGIYLLQLVVGVRVGDVLAAAEAVPCVCPLAGGPFSLGQSPLALMACSSVSTSNTS